MRSEFDLKIVPQDTAGDAKGDRNPKRKCRGCMVEIASSHILAFRTSNGQRTNMWPHVFLLKQNLLFEVFVFRFHI